VLYLTFRYYPEKRAAAHFLDALVAGNTNQAFHYGSLRRVTKIGDFLADWGPEGYYGPVKSYAIVKATARKGANGVI